MLNKNNSAPSTPPAILPALDRFTAAVVLDEEGNSVGIAKVAEGPASDVCVPF